MIVVQFGGFSTVEAAMVYVESLALRVVSLVLCRGPDGCVRGSVMGEAL